MIYIAAFTLGFGLLGFELLQFRAMDTFIDQAFVFLVPLFLFGTAVGNALGSWVSASRERLVSRAAALSFATLLAVNLAVYALASSWWWRFLFGFGSSLLATLAWGLSVVLLFRVGRPLKVNAALAFGGLAAAFMVPAMDAFGFVPVTKAFMLLVAVGLGISEFRSRLSVAAAGIVGTFAAIFPFALPDPMPESPSLAVYSNSYANIKVTPMIHALPSESGVVKGESRWDVKSDDNLRVFSVFRNRLEATLIFDAREKSDLEILKQETAHALYGLGNRGSLAVLGAGGGTEILRGQLHGFKKITAVEINPLMVQAAKDFSRNTFGYGAGNVETHIEEGRLFFRRLPADVGFDLIALTSTRNYGRLGVSVFAENYLLSRDAFSDYISHLNPDGLLIVRITQGFRVVGSLLVSLSQAAREGELYQVLLPPTEAVNFRGAKEQVLIYKKGIFTDQQLRTLDSLSENVRPMRLQVKGRGAPAISDDRPYGSTRANYHLDDIPFGAIPVGLVVLQSLFMLGLIGLQRQRDKSAMTWPLLYSFLSGWVYAATQGLLLDKVTFLTGQPAFSLAAVLMGFFVAAGVMSVFVERANSLFSEKKLVTGVLMTGAVFGLAQISVLWLSRFPLNDGVLSLVALTAILSTAAVSAWTFAYFFKYYSSEPTRIPFLLCANGLGSLLAGIQCKSFAVDFGFSAALVAVLIVYVGMAALPILRSART